MFQNNMDFKESGYVTIYTIQCYALEIIKLPIEFARNYHVPSLFFRRTETKFSVAR